jgi:MerR family copper efflux transcriptional regulator
MADVTSKERMQIGEVARRAELSLRTVRYYEELGLVAPEERTDGGFRLYTQEHVYKFQLIRRMKPLGFTLEEMREVLDAREAVHLDPTNTAARATLARFADDAARRSADLAAKAQRGEQLVDVLRRESRGDVLPGTPPEFGPSPA